MLYHLLAPLAKQHILFNLFNYLTFRAAGATVTALLLAFLGGPAIIRRLRERNVGQVIRAEGPASHQTKRGTPTMGGLIILLATVVPTLGRMRTARNKRAARISVSSRCFLNESTGAIVSPPTTGIHKRQSFRTSLKQPITGRNCESVIF